MPIKVACKCGQKFTAKDELAGKVVKCPKCEKPLKVPAASKESTPVATAAPRSGSLADLLDEAGLTAKQDDYQGRHCPSCNSPLAENALLCVGCGLNLETGRFIRGSGPIVAKDKAKQAEGHEGAAERLLSRAENALVQEKVEQIKNVREGAPIWAILCTLVVLGTLAVSMSMMPRREAFELSGWVCIIVCGIVQAAAGLHLLVLAFKEDVLVGVLYLFVPFYALYFVITRWNRCRQTFLIIIVAALASLFGYGMLWLATIVPEPSQETGCRTPHAVPPSVMQPYDPSLTCTSC